MIPFSHDAQALTYRKVEQYLTQSELFRQTLQPDPTQPRFAITYEGAIVIVDILSWEVHPWEAGDLAIVKASSRVQCDVPVDERLLRGLLQENARARFGAFQLDDQNCVVFADTILGGEGMDVMELQTCILAVVTIASTYRHPAIGLSLN